MLKIVYYNPDLLQYGSLYIDSSCNSQLHQPAGKYETGFLLRPSAKDTDAAEI